MPLEHDQILRMLLGGRTLLLAYIQAIVRDVHLAEDVFQEVSVLAMNKRAEIVDETHFRGWIRRAARLESRCPLRQRHRVPSAVSEQVLDAREAHWVNYDNEWAAQRLEALRQCVASLTDNAQRLVRLRYQEGVSGVALAEQFGKPVNTIYVALSRIHRTLAECVERRIAAAE
jgi:RNA polymerase sigma-70 factor (ECF subfamily)